MKAFLSYSSADRNLVKEVYETLEPKSAWIDYAEIEWGILFLEKIANGIKEASDFVLFRSKHSAESEWVKIEMNMGPHTKAQA